MSIIIIIILFKSGNKAHKHKQRHTDRQIDVKERKQETHQEMRERT